MIDPLELRVGDRVVLHAGTVRYRATVDGVTESSVMLCWGLFPLAKRADVLLKNSPLWRLMEPVT